MASRSERKSETQINAQPHPRRHRSRDGLNAPQWEAVYGSRPRPRPRFNYARCRINQIQKLIEHRHDGVVPDTDDADRYVWVVAQHMAQINPDAIEVELLKWCKRWAPNFPEAEITRIASGASENPYRFKPDTIAHKLGVKMAERTALRLTTIGAIDCTAEQRAAARADKKRRRARRRAARSRRDQGKAPRSVWLAKCLSQTKPWEDEGISRRTWERRRAKKEQEQLAKRAGGEVVEFPQDDGGDPPAIPADFKHPETEAEWQALATRRRRPLGKGALQGKLKSAA